jgi:restriction endonuclease Mrr
MKILVLTPLSKILKIPKITNQQTPNQNNKMTPEQIIFQQWSIACENLTKELRSLITKKSKENPQFFRQIVGDFIEKLVNIEPCTMSYSGLLENGDIDITCRKDLLGSDPLWVMASMRDELITKEELQKFADSFDGTKNGMFITLSDFEPDIETNASDDFITGDKKIRLLNGHYFSQWLMRYNMGTRTIATYEIKAIDYNFINNRLDDVEKTTYRHN